LNAERARLNTALQRLETDKTAAEGKARVMESAAYAAFTIALIAIVSSLFFVIRKKSTGLKWIGPEIPARHSSVADSQFKSKGGDTQLPEAGERRSSSLEPAQASISNPDIVSGQSESGTSDTKSTPNPEMPTEQIQSEAKRQTESAV
jgi:hypothetical protein